MSIFDDNLEQLESIGFDEEKASNYLEQIMPKDGKISDADADILSSVMLKLYAGIEENIPRDQIDLTDDERMFLIGIGMISLETMIKGFEDTLAEMAEEERLKQEQKDKEE